MATDPGNAPRDDGHLPATLKGAGSTRSIRPLISVCIPAYNRPDPLRELLESIAAQTESDYEILIREDSSPGRLSIRATVDEFRLSHPRITTRYLENEGNLGYDGNLRALVDSARGSYCMFMGNDDLVAPGALGILAVALRAHPETQVVLRTYATFDSEGRQVVHRYFAEPRFFPPGAESIVTFFRRSIVISGLCVHRDNSADLRTGQFDGTLLYQLYLVGMLMARGPGLSLPEVLALYRLGGSPDFGVSPVERAYVPGKITPDSSLAFVRGMLVIAEQVERQTKLHVYRPIIHDVANYSYPLLREHAPRPLGKYLPYFGSLLKLGLWRGPPIWAYFFFLAVLGPARSDRVIERLRTRVKATPRLGRFSAGRALPRSSRMDEGPDPADGHEGIE
jgi:Glycosyltransferases involved in cell wall biogenesis